MISTLGYHFAWGFSVRYPLVFAGLCAGLIVGSQAGAAARGAAPRKVELISMTGSLPIAEAAPSPNVLASMNEASPLPDAFQVHDLSRRYVQFRMQQEMAASGATPAVAPVLNQQTAGIAAFSSIQVPGWLRGGTTVQPISFKAGCAPLAYRPSGFLARSAEARRAAYYGMMSAVACEHGIPTGLFDAMIIRESGYNPIATSTANAYGLAQLMPGTAVGLGVNRYDPLQNMRGGARYLRQQLDHFGQVHLALAAYNAGPGRVRGGLVPRITETQAYVTNIIANWSRLTSPMGSPATMSTLPKGYSRAATLTQF
jgi:soluble lytic murein transglycosylase-like protein